MRSLPLDLPPNLAIHLSISPPSCATAGYPDPSTGVPLVSGNWKAFLLIRFNHVKWIQVEGKVRSMEREKEGTQKEVGKKTEKEKRKEKRRDTNGEKEKEREVERDRNGDRSGHSWTWPFTLSVGTSLCHVLLLKTGNPCLGGHPGDPKRHRQELHKGCTWRTCYWCQANPEVNYRSDSSRIPGLSSTYSLCFILYALFSLLPPVCLTLALTLDLLLFCPERGIRPFFHPLAYIRTI